jgi:undecaprenyl-diphosphatase
VNRDLGWPLRSWAGVRWPLVLTLLVLFSLLGIAAHRTDAFGTDVRFTRWLQGLDWRVLDWVADATNWSMSGTPLTICAIAFVLFLVARRWWIDAGMLTFVIAIRLVNSGLKSLIESPRPTSDLVEVIEEADNFGFPSGHASGALLVVGGTAWIMARHVTSSAWRIAIWTIAGAWIILSGIGRVLVGAHWPSDVLGAWLWSVAAMVVITWGTEKVRTREVAESEGAD